ncbi:hypothetical protein QEN19_001136 [Hanseniaspora menglaensis]
MIESLNKDTTNEGKRQLRKRKTEISDNVNLLVPFDDKTTKKTSTRLRSRAGKENIDYNFNRKKRKTKDIIENSVCIKTDRNKEINLNYSEFESDSSLSDYEFPETTNIKVVLGRRPEYITNPSHIIKPARYNKSIETFFNSYKTFIDDRDMTLTEYNENIATKRQVYAEIEEAIADSRLKIDPVNKEIKSTTVRDYTYTRNFVEPIKLVYKEQNLFSLQDHLINHAIVMRNLFNQVQKNRNRIIRKIANMVELHFKNIRNAKEREFKDRIKYEKQMCKKISTMVKKHWLLASKAYNIINEKNVKETEELERKKNLNEMLEKSSKLLDRQINNPSISPENSDDYVSKSDSDSHLDDNMDDDDHLSVEELRLKYGTINEDLKDSENLKDISGESLSEADEIKLTEFEMKIMKDEEDNKKNSILDESSDDFSASSGDNSTSESDGDVDLDEESNITDEQGLSALVNDINSESSDEGSISELSDYPLNESNVNKEEISKEFEADIVNKTKEPNQLSKINDHSKIEDSDENTIEDVETPSLLKGSLRIYQKQGLNWLANLYNTGTNGILADEMGLGKTIQTISLLCYLAEIKHVWGPHLIIVPTSVLLNWEMEFKKFAPGLKILSYYGSPNERAKKRKGWNTPDTFHVVITSYQLAVTDQHVFKRKKWGYMILDEAHNIKNFRSGRWQALLSFNSVRRLLLTGTPLQNNLTELWSLLYFLMPKTLMESGELEGFADLESFQEWFGKPVDKLIEQDKETNETEQRMKIVNKLHQILRPYLLRRLKKDVEKQMPAKYEHIVLCKLSKRQRYLYDEFMSRTQTKETLKSGNYLSIINCLMQLRKVCNHPDLFEVRPIVTSFAFKKNINHEFVYVGKKILKLLQQDISKVVDKDFLNLTMTIGSNITAINHTLSKTLSVKYDILKQVEALRCRLDKFEENEVNFQNIESFYTHWEKLSIINTINKLLHLSYINEQRLNENAAFSNDILNLLTIIKQQPEQEINIFEIYKKLIENFCFITPSCLVLENNDLFYGDLPRISFPESPFHQIETNLSIEFPDKFLLQYDCGKLQKLATLLKELKDGGHKVLIFTQMTKILDILEIFLNYHHYTYSRLDGATKIEDRQLLTERFNSDPKIFTFILSSRSGGVGINLTGADTVIFYDSDWNPAMDKQCQDRCHRIGQMRDVNIYRLVSEHTIESNILNKAMQKTQLDNLVIQDGNFNTDFLNNMKNDNSSNLNNMLTMAEDEDDSKAAMVAIREMDKNEVQDANEFNEGSESIEGELVQEIDEDEIDDPNDPKYHEGTRHVEDYMLRFISAGYYY